MNILCVGNSFAVDVSTYVHQIAKSNDLDINICVLYIGGCPIDLHWKNFLSKEKAYDFYINGEPKLRCDIFEGLNYMKWDYITFQQRSGDSVDSNTFFPELTKLMEGIRKYSNATYLLHKTWSYSKSFSHERYGSNPMDQEAMTKDIDNAYIEASERSGIKYIIPSGKAIEIARRKYGDKLDRDGYHLNELGRVLTGLLWVTYFTNSKVDVSKYHSKGYSYDEVTPPVKDELLKELEDIALEAIKENKGYNLYD
jgi:hypothetical protein